MSRPADRYTTRQYATALRAVFSPSEFRAVARGILAIALDHEDPAERLRAAEWLALHSKGRPGTAAPAVDPLELPRVHDAASALECYGRILEAVSAGQVCADSARLYQSLVGDAAKIALASRTVSLLASGGALEFPLTDEGTDAEVIEDAQAALLATLQRLRAAHSVAAQEDQEVPTTTPAPEHETE